MKKFSLIIPVAPNRNAEILNSINKLNYPQKEFEVFVEKGLNPSENRNRGATKAIGKILCFLDDDAVLPSNFLINAEKFFEKYKDIDIVGGPQLTPKNEKGFAKISGYALSSKFGAWKLAKRYNKKKIDLNADERSITSANLLCRKEVFRKIKFDTSLFPGEDPKFISDAKKENLSVAYSPSIVVYHRRRGSIKALVKQMFNYGKFRPAKESFLQTIKNPFFIMPSLFAGYLILLIILILLKFSLESHFFNLVLTIFALPLAIYVFLAILFSVHDSLVNKDFSAVLILLFIYPIIHISYGAGMIYGQIKKLIKNENLNRLSSNNL